MRRVIQIRLEVDLSITFELGGKQRIVELRKNEAVVLWHADHAGLVEIANQFNENGFDILQMTKSQDGHYIQVISKIKTEQ
jgi:hypothetical protein